ncbi:hypothetical protein GAMM_110056 [Gammaproteobacteria bacterium]
MYKIKLSPYAKIFYTEWLLDPNGCRYNLSIDQTLYGNLDVDRLRAALKKYVAEHVILNSHIQNINEEPHWVKNDSIRELEYSDNHANTSALFSYVSRSFDLYNESLYRFRLLRINENTHRLILVFHHIVVDGSASLDLGVFEAISNYYGDESYKIKYSIDDQIKLISDLTSTLSTNLVRNQDKHKEFWRQQLSDIENTNLSFLKSSKNFNGQNEMELEIPSNPKEEINFCYGDSELYKLGQIKLKHGITPYVYGQCIFALLLYKYTGQNRLAISYPIAINEGLDFIYGAQLNTNFVPYQFNQTTTIIDLFNQSKDFFKLTIRDSIKYGYYPVTDIIRDGASKQLLNIYFTQAFFIEHPFKFNGITKTEIFTTLSTDGVTKDVLLFEHNARNNKLNYRVRYDKNTIDKNLINNFVASYKKLYLEILDDLLSQDYYKEISSYNLLAQEQYQKIIHEFNKTDKEYPHDKTIHKLFEEQVLKTPSNIALVYEDVKLTYQELNSKANQLANYLRQNYDIKPDDLVALCLDRSEQMLIAILGVLKSGGAYVPLDPDYPNDRIGYILADIKTKVLLTNDVHTKKLQQVIKQITEKMDVLAIDSKETQIELANQKRTNPLTSTASTNLAYVIYTSGTTGNPKGVMIEHNGVINTILSLCDVYDFSKGGKSTAFTSYTFDVSVSEFFIALFRGAELHMLSKAMKQDILLLSDYIKNVGINYVYLPPALLSVLPRLEYESLRGIVYAGEPCDKETGGYWSCKYTLHNYYGPTEATIYATGKQVLDGDTHLIGSPISNTKCYILDKNLFPLPIGVIGELYIGGVGLARGYLNRPELVERFIINPFQTPEEKSQNKNSRLYKTGDLVRWLSDGNIEYIGRNDFQVKVRGYRIELGEIENKLAGYPSIKQTVALVKSYEVGSANNSSIIAYYVADKKLDDTKIHKYLTTQLPEYMLPNMLVYLDKLPLTISGKLDRKALPNPIFENNNKYEAPSNEQEKFICEEYARILGIKRIGINDDFFSLGGNSIQAIKLTSILQANFDIKIADIFNLRTPKKLAKDSGFGKNFLQHKLEMVRLVYKERINNKPIDAKSRQKFDVYTKSVASLSVDISSTKPINNILLTGSTGYLGCNLLNQLLELTNYKIYLLIRANSQAEAVERINKKYQFYFGRSLDNIIDNRVFIINANIEKNHLGLSQSEYQKLTTNIDSVIHAAALVKHYGEYDKFYSANVQATINLLELAKLTKLKNFHYISTTGVLYFAALHNIQRICTEDDLPNGAEILSNVYVQTKLLGEHQVVKYRDYGINSSIYRVGNLAFISKNYKAQENIEDNAFYSWLKCLFTIKSSTQSINTVEISQTDLTAQAIVKLFDKQALNNQIHHVFNPYLFNMTDVLKGNGCNMLSTESFIDRVEQYINNGDYHDLIVRFLVHQGWADWWDKQDIWSIRILQSRTQHILKQLGFKWFPITNKVAYNYLSSLKLTGNECE